MNNIHAKEKLLSWLDNQSFKEPGKIILKALSIACSANKRKLKYVEGILRNWENESLLTVEEIELHNNKKGISKSRYDPNKDKF